jgi:hypothetical protein
VIARSPASGQPQAGFLETCTVAEKPVRCSTVSDAATNDVADSTAEACFDFSHTISATRSGESSAESTVAKKMQYGLFNGFGERLVVSRRVFSHNHRRSKPASRSQSI